MHPRWRVSSCFYTCISYSRVHAFKDRLRNARLRVMGIWALIFGGMIPLGSLEAGLMADFLGTPATMAIGALICAFAALVTLRVIRKREAQLGTSAQRVGA